MTHEGWPIVLQRTAFKEAGLKYHARSHTAKPYMWYCVLYGNVDMPIDGKVFPLNPEESILIPPGKVRAPRCRNKPPGYMYAFFHNRGLDLDPIAGRALSLPEDLRPDLHALAEELRLPSGPNTEELTTALIVRLLIGLRRAAVKDTALKTKPSPLNASARQEVVVRLEAFMRRNLHRPFTRKDLAAAANLSSPHVARVFRAATGNRAA